MSSKLYVAAALVTLAASHAALASEGTEYACQDLVRGVVAASELTDDKGMTDDDQIKDGIKVDPKSYSQVKILSEKEIWTDGDRNSKYDLTVQGQRLKGTVRVHVGRFGICNIERISLK